MNSDDVYTPEWKPSNQPTVYIPERKPTAKPDVVPKNPPFNKNVIAPHVHERTTAKDVWILALKQKASMQLEQLACSLPCDLSAVEEGLSLSMMKDKVPAYALYNTGIALRAATETLGMCNLSDRC